MSVVGTVVRGRAAKVRCDGCGRISGAHDGYYFDKTLQRGGHISGQGRECRHDFCKECEKNNDSACPKCAVAEKESVIP